MPVRLQYHNYKLIWTRTYLVWMIDSTVYRNISCAHAPPSPPPSSLPYHAAQSYA